MREGAGRLAATLILRPPRLAAESNSFKRKMRGATISSGADRTQPQLGAFFVIEFIMRLPLAKSASPIATKGQIRYNVLLWKTKKRLTTTR